jgi:uncharacterized RDD family membrane protein YckC
MLDARARVLHPVILAINREVEFAAKLPPHGHPIIIVNDREPAPPQVPASLFRRLAALVYDSLLLLAVLFLGTLMLLPLTGGESITPQDSGPWEYLYRGWIALLTLGFFGLSWTRRGQTLGMMSWKIRLLRDDGSLPRWRDAALRFLSGALTLLCALLGLVSLAHPADSPLGYWAWALLLPSAANYLWVFLDPESRSLQDRLTRCRVVRLG